MFFRRNCSVHRIAVFLIRGRDSRPNTSRELRYQTQCSLLISTDVLVQWYLENREIFSIWILSFVSVTAGICLKNVPSIFLKMSPTNYKSPVKPRKFYSFLNTTVDTRLHLFYTKYLLAGPLQHMYRRPTPTFLIKKENILGLQ